MPDRRVGEGRRNSTLMSGLAIKKHSGEELDIKPYEADMRHLISAYIQADPADQPRQPEFDVADRVDH